MDRKEEILRVTAELAAKKGLGNVSLSQIASQIGISKAALYNHYSSKEEIIMHLYEYLRNSAKGKLHMSDIDYGEYVKGKDASSILHGVVDAYRMLGQEPEIASFFKVVCSEQYFSKDAADIMRRETDRMIRATKNLFYAMEIHKILHFKNIDQDALSFAMTIHGLQNYDEILQLSENMNAASLIDDYITHFCQEYQV